MHFMYALSNLLLIAACVYALIVLKPRVYPYAFLMASFCLIHGLMGLFRSFYEELDECSRAFVFWASILEVIPLPLANMEFYRRTALYCVAKVHSIRGWDSDSSDLGGI